jgi:hypothetical protein
MFILLGNSCHQEWSTIDNMELVFSIFFATLAFSFGLAYWATFDKLKKCNLLIAQLFIKNKALEQISFQLKNSTGPSDDVVHKENFIKFLSDSRDWAFGYIEDVQKGLTKFIEEVDPSINYFSEFSTLSEGHPLHDDMKKISIAYKDLKKFLPEDYETKK